MAIPQDLLDLLACPVCRVSVRLTQDGSGLACPSCHRIYPIRDGIPVMLPDEATQEDADGNTPAPEAQ